MALTVYLVGELSKRCGGTTAWYPPTNLGPCRNIYCYQFPCVPQNLDFIQMTFSAEKLLPDPDAFQDPVDTVIWDGNCNFCRMQVKRLASFDGGRLAYLSLHDSRVKELCPDLSFEQLMEQMWLVTSGGKRFGGADAVKYLSRSLVRLWWLAPLMHIPFTMPLWRWLYRLVAKLRYRIAGRNCESEACDIHR